MSHVKKHRHVDIPLKINGFTGYIKGVTKYTTCGDVIKMVLKKSPTFGQDNPQLDSYAIFESSRGIERILPGKSRFVKVMRSWGTDSNFEFVFRKVNPIVSMPKISEAKRRRLTQRLRTVTGSENNSSNTQQNKFSEARALAGLVQSQKTKLNRYESLRSNEFVKELYFKDSEDSMDEFISCVDKTHMGGILDFCGAVTSDEINKLSTNFNGNRKSNIPATSDMTFVDSNHVSMTKVNNVKYAVRKTLKSQTLSTSNICSVSSDENNLNCRPLKHKFIDSSPRREPHHSTPSNKVQKMDKRLSKRHEELASDIVTKVTRINQKDGKNALLQKYFSDYITYNSPKHRTRSSRRTRGDGAESGYQSPLCRRGDGAEDATQSQNLVPRDFISPVYNDNDTDSGQEEESFNFDTAFIDETPNIPERLPTCVSKLVDYSLSEDELSFTADPSIIDKVSDVSSVSDIVKNAFSDSNVDDEDDLMESFMNTKHAEDFLSDEGLSSMGSDDEKEIIV